MPRKPDSFDQCMCCLLPIREFETFYIIPVGDDGVVRAWSGNRYALCLNCRDHSGLRAPWPTPHGYGETENAWTRFPRLQTV